MVQKKDDDKSKDLTSIEDLSEFNHQTNAELDSRFDDFAQNIIDFTKTSIKTDNDEMTSDGFTDFPPDLPGDGLAEELAGPSDFQFTEELPPVESLNVEPQQDFEEPTDILLDDNPDKSEESELFNQDEDNEAHTDNETLNDGFEERDNSYFLNSIPEEINEPLVNTTEKFEDVKTFAHNFSYGKSSGVGGNPPFSIIARNIRYEEDADTILNLLEEFGVLNPQNERDFKTSLDLGTLLIPQISEYMAIVIAHKLRRFDLDLEVGLSDEIHPSKSGETNPRGLIKKENLKQNKFLQVKLDEIDFKISDIILSTANTIDGYKIDHYLGIESCFAIIDEEDLERLNYVQKSQRESSKIMDFSVNDEDDKSTQSSFDEFQESFNVLYEDLRSQMRQKALLKKANALLGFNYQVSPVHFDKGHQKTAAYHITCSATLASISKDAE